MNITALIESREKNWQELEAFVARLNSFGGRASLMPEEVARFTALHRAVCADLALCRSYRLPPGTIAYLNDLVGRSHNLLYTDQSVTLRSCLRMLIHEAPYRIFNDKTFWTAMLLFWGPFFLSWFLAATSPGFAEKIVGQETLDAMEQMYSISFEEMESSSRFGMVGFYIQHNASIGLMCFALGALFMVPGILITLFNAVQLGTIFGYMTHSENSANFFEFVTAHGPFELTAIVLASGAGLRLGFSLIHTRGLAREDSIRLAAKEAVPIITVATLLFCFAALIEAFVSPNPMGFVKVLGIHPHAVKISIAVICTFMLLYYIVVLGYLQTLQRRRERGSQELFGLEHGEQIDVKE